MDPAQILGSGISRSSGIPTGWEIVLDLIRQVAHLRKESCEPEPDAWFTRAFGLEPNYSDVVDQIAKSPAERLQVLRGYFEPTAGLDVVDEKWLFKWFWIWP